MGGGPVARTLGVAVAAVTATAAYGVLPPTPAVAAPARLPSTEAATPAVVSPTPGRRDLFWTQDGALLHQHRPSGGSWGRALSLDGSLASQPAAVSWGPGRLDVFARGTDDALRWRVWRNGRWSGWRSLGGRLTSAPAASSWARGRLDVFVRGTDGGLHQRTFRDRRWSGWKRLGGRLTSSPAAASWAPGRIDVVARTGGRALAHRVFRVGRGWTGWRNLGGRLSAQPAAATPVPGRLDVLQRGPAGRVTVRSLRAGRGWTPARRIGSRVVASGPAAVAVGDDVLVAARSTGGAVVEARRRSPTARWSPWRRVDALRPFRGLATWVDVFDYPVLDPATAVPDMRARGVRTLFLATARFDSAGDFHDPVEMGQWLDAAHDAGIAVVGWYVPAYGDMARDVRRTAAIARFVSPGGERFDAVGVDIERFGPSGEVDRATFNDSVAPHLRRVRRRSDAVVAAIVPSPFVTEPGNNWEGFPWRRVGAQSDVVVPMALWSFRSNDDGSPFSAAQVRAWVLDQTVRARALTGGLPVHVEGGVDDPGAERSPVTPRRVQAFVQGIADGGALGGGHYDYATTVARLWPVLAGING